MNQWHQGAIGRRCSVETVHQCLPRLQLQESSVFEFNLSHRTAIVTGGASGIGRAAAIRLAQAGARVFIGDLELRTENKARFAELEIDETVCDVRQLDQLQRLIDRAAERTGRLDILVSNAGITQVGQVHEISEAQWDSCLDTNLKAAFFGAKFAIPHMRRTGGGVIVHTASNAGLLPRAHDPVYSISKLALVGLTKSLALSHSKDGIRINCVCPGPVSNTAIMEADINQQPDPVAAAQRIISASPLARVHGRMITPEEVADAILYLVSDAALMVTGTAIAIDGGKSLGVPPAPDGFVYDGRP
jgi:NAD(P)-dependent dehydrogenase (short-subunit alcohol dehydrogenase family)